MKPGLLRIVLYSVVALALAGALRFTPQLPDPERKPAEILVAQAATPSWKLREPSIGSLRQPKGLETAGPVDAISTGWS